MEGDSSISGARAQVLVVLFGSTSTAASTNRVRVVKWGSRPEMIAEEGWAVLAAVRERR
jgi:hypothetical protein